MEEEGHPVLRTDAIVDLFDRARTDDLYQLVIDNLDDHCIILLTTDGAVVSWSKGAERITGYSAENVIGRSLSFIDLPEGAPLRADALWHARSYGRWTHQGWWVRHDGEHFWVDETVAPLLEGAELVGFITIARDLTERRHAAEAHAEALRRERQVRADLEAAKRAKSDFLAVVSHELRTPLNAIMGYSDILAAGISGPITRDQTRQLRKVRASARHLLQLIEEILSYARLEAGDVELDAEKTTVRDIMDAAAAVVELVAHSKNVELRLHFRGEEEPVWIDAAKARQILVNLLSNAVKFTDVGHVDLIGTVANNRVRFDVSDTGIGMSKDQVQRIFDPFVQAEPPTTRRVGGTGLGLSVARRFARLLGGEITVRSAPGAGSTFTVQLPLHPGQESTS